MLTIQFHVTILLLYSETDILKDGYVLVKLLSSKTRIAQQFVSQVKNLFCNVNFIFKYISNKHLTLHVILSNDIYNVILILWFKVLQVDVDEVQLAYMTERHKDGNILHMSKICWYILGELKLMHQQTNLLPVWYLSQEKI